MTTQEALVPSTRSNTLTTAAVWRELSKASFAVLGHLTATGEPRSSGVVYAVARGRLWVAVAPDGRKAREIATGADVSVTVPVRRGGLLALLFPIPPATITFQAEATVHSAGVVEPADLPEELVRLLPADRRASACVIELVPHGRFLTYGVGVSLNAMRDPATAIARVPVS